jgi:hypothetical protein
MSSVTANWRELNKPDLDIMNLISSEIARVEAVGRAQLPALDRTQLLYIASDYGGSHKGAGQAVYTFLITDKESLVNWREDRLNVRAARMAADPSRTFAYKKLKDAIKNRALGPFLQTVNNMNGLLFTIGIDGRRRYLTPEARENRLPTRFADYDRDIFERMHRIVHVISLLLAGLSREGQNVCWITDDDPIASNPTVKGDLEYALRNVAPMYLRHNLGWLQCETASSLEDRLFAEDFVAIPDLVSGSLCELATDNPPGEEPVSTQIVVPLKKMFRTRTKAVLDWYLDETCPLKRLYIELQATDEPTVNLVFARQLVRIRGAGRSPYVLT